MKTKLPKKSAFLKPLLDEFTQELVKVYADKLLGVILFGSYARGNFRQDSDVDIMLLFETENFKGVRESEAILDYTTDILIDRGVDINLLPTSEYLWNKPFSLYKNTKKEGIWLWKK